MMISIMDDKTWVLLLIKIHTSPYKSNKSIFGYTSITDYCTCMAKISTSSSIYSIKIK